MTRAGLHRQTEEDRKVSAAGRHPRVSHSIETRDHTASPEGAAARPVQTDNMAKKMLIDATHAEETRVVVVDGNKVEEFDFESENKRRSPAISTSQR